MNTTHAQPNDSVQPVGRSLAPSACASVALGLLVCGTAHAADAKAPPAAGGPVLTERTLVVKFADLDLATDSGARAANERILIAARKACDSTTAAGDYVVGRNEVFRACLDRTMAAATEQLEQLRLAALRHAVAKVVGNAADARTSPEL